MRNNTIREWIDILNSGGTIRLNVVAFNEFFEVYSYFFPGTELQKEVDYNMITFKLKSI